MASLPPSLVGARSGPVHHESWNANRRPQSNREMWSARSTPPAERARPLPCSRNIGTACGLLHWVDGPSDGPTVLRCCLDRPFDRGDRVADRPLHILLASNSASNLTDRRNDPSFISVPRRTEHGRAHVVDLLRRKEARVNPAPRRRIAPFPFIFSMTTQTPYLSPPALLRPPPRTKIRIIDFTSINHAATETAESGRLGDGRVGGRARLRMTLFSALRPVFRRHSRRGAERGESTSRRCCLRTSTDYAHRRRG